MKAHFKTAAAILALGLTPLTAALPALAQDVAIGETGEVVNMSIGTGRLIDLPRNMTDLYIGNDAIADVQIKSPRQIYILGKAIGETSIQAADKSGNVMFSANIAVGQNTGTVGEMLRMAMPEANITTTPMNNLVLLTGTVATPADLSEAEELVAAYVGGGVRVLNRLKTATPMQVSLKVRIAEVARSTIKNFGVNIAGAVADPGRYDFDFSRGNPDVAGAGMTLGLAGKVLGFDLITSLDLAETDGLSTTLAEPVLSALSGETASFVAGGEFPIPVSGDMGQTTIQFKQYGVKLNFTPTVHSDGRITLRVAPEVSQLTSAGAVQANGISIPALTTRTVTTTVELGSGQSYMIAGLLQNDNGNDVSKVPLLGDLPIIGALFRSTSFRKNETELVIVVTPYLVRPVSGQLPLPTDGYRHPNDFERQLEGQPYAGVSGATDPTARVGTAPRPQANAPVQPGFSL